MSYTITSKIEVIDSEIVRFPIAFINTEANMGVFDSWISWDEWVENNLSEDEVLPEHSISPVCFEGSFVVEEIERVNEMNIEIKETI